MGSVGSFDAGKVYIMPTASPSLLSLAKAYEALDIEFPSLKAVTLAQWILESGWGSSELANKYNNFGGIKYRKDMQNIAKSVKYSANDGIDYYCWFDTLEDFVKGYWTFLDRPPYKGWRSHANDPESFIYFIGHIYTPSPAYAERVLDLLIYATAYLKGETVHAPLIRNAISEVLEIDSPLAGHGHGNPTEKPQVDKFVTTTHQSSRNGSTIDYIVIHYTTSRNIEGTIETFIKGRIDPKTGKLIRTSAHYIVARDGQLVQMVNDSDAAWHAGGKDGMNSRSIGIEHSANEGDQLTSPQEAKSAALIRWLVSEYKVPLSNIIPHDAVHSTSCPGAILSAYGATHQDAVRAWVASEIAPQENIV